MLLIEFVRIIQKLGCGEVIISDIVLCIEHCEFEGGSGFGCPFLVIVEKGARVETVSRSSNVSLVVVEGGGVTHRLGDERRGVVGEVCCVCSALSSVDSAELDEEYRGLSISTMLFLGVGSPRWPTGTAAALMATGSCYLFRNGKQGIQVGDHQRGRYSSQLRVGLTELLELTKGIILHFQLWSDGLTMWC